MIKNLTIILLSIVHIIISIYLNALLYATLWAWFVTPVFHIDPISLAQAYGLAMIPTLFLTQAAIANVDVLEDRDRKLLRAATKAVALYLVLGLTFLSAWICKAFFI
jgi:hypothetical protein